MPSQSQRPWWRKSSNCLASKKRNCVMQCTRGLAKCPLAMCRAAPQVARTHRRRYLAMTDGELLQAFDSLRNTMVAVATGGPRINDVNDQFQQTYALVAAALARRRIENPLPYASLWD